MLKVFIFFDAFMDIFAFTSSSVEIDPNSLMSHKIYLMNSFQTNF